MNFFMGSTWFQKVEENSPTSFYCLDGWFNLYRLLLEANGLCNTDKGQLSPHLVPKCAPELYLRTLILFQAAVDNFIFAVDGQGRRLAERFCFLGLLPESNGGAISGFSPVLNTEEEQLLEDYIKFKGNIKGVFGEPNKVQCRYQRMMATVLEPLTVKSYVPKLDGTLWHSGVVDLFNKRSETIAAANDTARSKSISDVLCEFAETITTQPGVGAELNVKHVRKTTLEDALEDGEFPTIIKETPVVLCQTRSYLYNFIDQKQCKCCQELLGALAINFVDHFLTSTSATHKKYIECHTHGNSLKIEDVKTHKAFVKNLKDNFEGYETLTIHNSGQNQNTFDKKTYHSGRALKLGNPDKFQLIYFHMHEKNGSFKNNTFDGSCNSELSRTNQLLFYQLCTFVESCCYSQNARMALKGFFDSNGIPQQQRHSWQFRKGTGGKNPVSLCCSCVGFCLAP